MSLNHGGCLCGAIRYATSADPVRVTYCHCKFCQRATGSAYMVEPIFLKPSFEITSGKPATYALASAGSGKQVTINFCSTCGTKLYLSFERFPTALGLYAGTFDNPNWFARIPKLSKHIFLSSAQDGTVIPPASTLTSSTRSSTTARRPRPRPSNNPTPSVSQAEHACPASGAP